MFDKTITVFSYRIDSQLWYVSVIKNVDIVASQSENATQHGEQNANGVIVLIQTDANSNVETTEGLKSYAKTKAFNSSETPEMLIAFQPLTDFIYEGVFEGDNPINDADCGDLGLYHKLNNELDGVHQVSACTLYTLIPHLEVNCK